MAIVFVGAGGAGVSGLAQLIVSVGVYSNQKDRVYDSTAIVAIDSTQSDRLHELASLGIQTVVGHGRYTVSPDDVVVYSQAASASPEVTQAFEHHRDDYRRSMRPFMFAELIGELSKFFSTIAITGTHGKTTTTAMTGYLAQDSLPTLAVGMAGTILPQWNNKGFYLAAEHRDTVQMVLRHILTRTCEPVETVIKQLHFIIEADEFNRHFHNLDIDYLGITNCEHDHFDTYPTAHDYYEAFRIAIRRTRFGAYIPAGALGYEQLESISTQSGTRLQPIESLPLTFSNTVAGHNISNGGVAVALVEAALQDSNSTQRQRLIQHLDSFPGTARRAEYLGLNAHGVKVFSDYAHHATEIASTVKAFHESGHELVHVIFEPHQMHRVLTLWDEFVAAMIAGPGEFRGVLPIYAAREDFETMKQYGIGLGGTAGVAMSTASSVIELTQAFTKKVGAEYIDSYENALEQIHVIKTGTIVICTAGPLDGVVRGSITK